MLNHSFRFHGIPVSSGISVGKAHVIENRPLKAEPRRIAKDRVEEEIERFRQAVEMASEEIRALRKRVAEAIDERQAQIFDAHLGMLSDPLVIERTIERVRNEQHNAEYAFQQNVNEIADRLAKIQDEFFLQRNNDILDVARRVLNNLMCLEGDHLRKVSDESIVVAHDLGPSDTAQMIRTTILGFCTNLGGKTSHTAIMAKALQIPAVVGLEDITQFVRNGDLLIVDGNEGTVILNPSPAELEQYQKLEEDWRSQSLQLAELRDLPAETIDGERVTLLANLELAEEVEHIFQHGAEGVGLFRTEFTYLNREHLPTEEELLGVYRRVLDDLGDLPVVFRTLDLGGDKFISAIPIEELNPFMGLRALRLCLENPEMFATQIRAILRACAGRPLHLLFPMVSGLEDFRKAKAFFQNVLNGLTDQGIEVPTEVKLGVMIEIPSAALTADLLAEEVDFFSIGTNDLIQYTLAVDRVNKRVAYLYEPLHPAVLRMVRMVVESAEHRGLPVSVCGEMAASPEMAAVLVGLGVRELSMGPISIPAVKRVLRSVPVKDLRTLADELILYSSAPQIRERLEQVLGNLLSSRITPPPRDTDPLPESKSSSSP